VNGTSYTAAVASGFGKLFAYISGSGNEANKEIAMTTPVLTKIHAGIGPTCGDSFTISFYVPSALANDPPKPSAADVAITRMPAMHVYVAAFGGFATDRSVAREASKLAEALKAAGVEVPDDADIYSASYDSPFRLLDRRNEVWLTAQ